MANQFKCQEVLIERLDILSGRNVEYWTGRQAGKGTITPDQKEEIKREGEALTEHLEGPSKTAAREVIYAHAKRWGVSQVANYRLRVARADQTLVDLLSQGSSHEKAGVEFNDDEAMKNVAPVEGATVFAGQAAHPEDQPRSGCDAIL